MNDYQEFHECVKDIALSDVFQLMDTFVQHGDISTMEHVLSVSLVSYETAKKKGLDYKLTARGAMLHDLYLYDWHIKDPKTRPPLTHGFTHPKRACENAKKYFDASPEELAIVRNHMWPLTVFHTPTSKEALTVSLSDKYCATLETLGIYDNSDLRKKVRGYMEFLKQCK